MPGRDPTRRRTRIPRLLERVMRERRRAEPQTQRLDDESDDELGAGATERRLQTLEARLERLETLVEGLQDSVHREAVRQRNLLSELLTRRAS